MGGGREEDRGGVVEDVVGGGREDRGGVVEDVVAVAIVPGEGQDPSDNTR